jgi:SAM-dependent methyltransferase
LILATPAHFHPRKQVNMPANSLYTDLSAYYDLLCADIDYSGQSQAVRRLHQLFGDKGRNHLDLACGTGPHVRHFIDFGYHSRGLDINQPMLDRAKLRCPEAQFSLQSMNNFEVSEPLDLITCFLYSIHYNQDVVTLRACISSAHAALKARGVFCFNAVDRTRIDNRRFARHSTDHDNSNFTFSSRWHYSGHGQTQALQLEIQKTDAHGTATWQEEHAMVAVSFAELEELLAAYFEVHILEHDYEKIMPWDRESGNAIFVCVKL